MALSKNVNMQYKSGLTIPVENVYIRINSYSGDKNSISIYVGKYMSYQHFLNGKESLEPIKIYSFTPDILNDSQNFIKQGYEYLKTLDEYKDAIDC